MKLRTRLAIQVLLFMMVGVMVIAGFLVYSFTDSFDRLLVHVEEERIQRVVGDISDIVRQEGFSFREDSWREKLTAYARNSNINISILDDSSRIQVSYEGLVEHDDQDLRVARYLLVDNEQNQIGTLLVTHDLNNPIYEKLQNRFLTGALSSLALLILAYTVGAYLLTSRFSRRITEPVEILSHQTSQLARADYDLDPVHSKVPEIQNLSSNLNYLASTLKNQEESRLNYAQDIAHELRTPLTNLSLEFEALEDGVVNWNEEVLKGLQANVNQLSAIVVGLKESFDDASSENRPAFESTNLTNLTNQILDSFERSIKKKSGLLVRVIDPMVKIDTDRRLYRQILANLLSNAIKAIDQGGRIRVSLNQAKNTVYLTVTDNGVGISKADQGHLFERFYRVDSSRNKKMGGSGLGLSITQNFVHQLGGRIEVTSRPGRGTSFRVIFEQDPLKG